MIEPLALKYKLNNQIEGVLVVQPGKENPPMYDGADKLLFIVSNGNLRNCKSIIHYIKDGKRIQERWINIEEMKVFLFTNSYIEIRNSLLKGRLFWTAMETWADCGKLF
ncbi:nucleotidyltransferase-like protein [Paenibacillus larvae]|nr:nucleotidyltransferase-like protein [Paenibacillus larvae]MDT2248657.1 nucleotidyltransferase-like protein [Paenibacillus larvae]MDT2258096.1 nucleotidyltransferase-like protein [Paenibacillus larvae]MDT2260473.1 nucleotidyltransferase-like protein [Paenibacillus larvae]MDT2276000.1 nucleotidyltransferase-like protein [Paenibacillus larvae]